MNRKEKIAKFNIGIKLSAHFILALTPLIAYSMQLKGGWRFDDAHHLLFLSKFNYFEYFYDFEAARLQSGSHYTPFNILTYDIANRLFSKESRQLWYLLHLAYLGCASILLFSLLSKVFDAFSGFFAALIFSLGFPIAAMSGQLMVGHYVLGLCFALAAMSTCRPSDTSASPISVLLYFLACLSKEIYFPFVIFIALRFEKISVKKIFPYIAVGLIFIALRAIVIGQLIGGYNKKSDLTESFLNLFFGFLTIFSQSTAHIFLAILIFIGAFFSIFEYYKKHDFIKTSLVATLVFASIFGPLTAVHQQVSPNSPGDSRLLLMAWLTAIYFIASLLHKLRKKSGNFGLAGFLMLALMTSIASYKTGQDILNKGILSTINKQFDLFSEYITDQHQCHLIDNHNGWSSWAYDLQLAILPLQVGHRVVAPDRIIDFMVRADSPVCKINDNKIELFRYTNQVECDQKKSLAVRMNFDGSNIAMNFGPEKSGTYYIDVAQKYVLAVPADFYGPFPSTDRFEKIKIYRIFDDESIGCTKEINFNPKTGPKLVEDGG